jgi:predicted acyltransferase
MNAEQEWRELLTSRHDVFRFEQLNVAKIVRLRDKWNLIFVSSLRTLNPPSIESPFSRKDMDSPITATSKRAYALDALRGFAILTMILSGQLPFHTNTLPDWMYHAQVPPPDHRFIPTLPGITWVDLVFPFFLFAMGAAFPLALTRRLEKGISSWRISLSILERGFLLGFFALYVQAIRPYVISREPDVATWLFSLLGFLLLFPMYSRLPEQWSPALRWSLKAGGWIGAILFLGLTRYPDGSGFLLTRSDIIIVVLTNMAVFGSFVWLLTRSNLLLRLGVLGILLAIRLSNMPIGIPGWVNDTWKFTPAPWIYALYYQQYLCIVIPGMIAGDMILKWMKESPEPSPNRWTAAHLISIVVLMVGFVLVALIGLKARWLIETTILLFVMCGLGWWLLSRPTNETEKLFKELFLWAIYWLVLGLFFEPYEGGIKKDRATVSYYFVTSGLAICTLIAFSVIIDVFKKQRWLQFLIDNGQNPMVAYAGVNNFIVPLLSLTSIMSLLTAMAITPWLGFVKGLIVTLLLAWFVSFCTKKKIFWRT